MPSWPLLGHEIHVIIFDFLAQFTTIPHSENAVGRPLNRKRRELCSYTLVCKDWHDFFNERLYRHLFINQTALTHLENFNTRQKQLVRYLWLKVDLEKYSCPDCSRRPQYFDSEVEFRQYDPIIFDEAIRKLFDILSSWDRDRWPCSEGLTLEISTFSPSDTEHVFYNDLHFDTDPFATTGDLERDRPCTTNSKHGWVSGQKSRPANCHSIRTIYGGSLGAVIRHPGLAEAKSVVTFVIRRQTRQHIPDDILKAILESLPNLRNLVLEPVRHHDCFPETGQYPSDDDFVQILLNALPQQVRSFTLFEDFNEDFDKTIINDSSPDDWVCPPELRRTPSGTMGAVLAFKSQHFKNLAASYILDAEDFLDVAVGIKLSWDNLTSLFLTCQHLTSSANAKRVSEIIVDAGKVALNMPALKRMGIWHGAKGSACAFSYKATDDESSIQWRGHWALSLHLLPNVMEAWRLVADRHTRKKLTMEREMILDADNIGSHAVAMKLLDVHDYVLHPVSFKQIACETERYWFK